LSIRQQLAHNHLLYRRYLINCIGLKCRRSLLDITFGSLYYFQNANSAYYVLSFALDINRQVSLLISKAIRELLQ